MSAASPNNYIAIIDDDGAIRTALGRALRMENYEVELFEDGLSALKAIQLRAPNAIILDLQLPDIDGLEVCRRIRKAGDVTPILMLTARDAVNDRVEGLDAGADDYLVKPFDLAELLARLRALLRRQGAGDGLADVMRFEDLTLNPQTREVFRGDRAVDLTKIEFDLLELFLQHPRQFLTREQILDLVWGYNFDSGTNSLAVYIGYLRRKLEDDDETKRLIQTVRGVGYALRSS
jgi:two-component system response regulator MprA